MLEYLLIFIQLVEDCVSILLLTGCENYNLKLLRHVLQESDSIRSNIDSKMMHASLLSFELDAHLQFSRRLIIIYAMYKCLI